MTVEFELDGQPFVALNGGPEFTFNEAISFQIDCDDQDEVDHYWERADRGRRGGPVRLAEGPLRAVVAGRPDAARASCSRIRTRRRSRAMAAMLEMRKIDVAELDRAADGAHVA